MVVSFKCKYLQKHNFWGIALTLIVMQAFVACEELVESWQRPADMSPYVSDDCVLTTGSWSVYGQTAAFNIEVVPFADFDYWQLKMESVDFFIDGGLVAKDGQAPFCFNHTAEGLDVGSHQLLMKVTLKDLVSGRDIVISPVKDFEIGTDDGEQGGGNLDGGDMAPDPEHSLSVSASWSYSGNSVSIIVSSVDLLPHLVDAGWKLLSVDFFIDDNSIGAVSVTPYSFKKTVGGLSRGTHYFKIKAKAVNSVNGEERELTSTSELRIGPGVNFYVDYNKFISVGALLEATPYFLDKRSDPSECEIKSVSYIVDGELVDVADIPPYSLAYNLQQDDLSHSLEVLVSYSTSTVNNAVFSMSFADIRFMQPDTHECQGLLKGKSTFFLGDELECVAKVYCGENVEESETVKVYLDDKFLGESSFFPYSCRYTLEHSDLGEHELRFEWTIYDAHGNVKERKSTLCTGIKVYE